MLDWALFSSPCVVGDECRKESRCLMIAELPYLWSVSCFILQPSYLPHLNRIFYGVEYHLSSSFRQQTEPFPPDADFLFFLPA